MTDAQTRKAALRREMEAKMAALTQTARRHAAETVAERALAWLDELGKLRVATCLSFGDELDTEPVIRRMRQKNMSIFVPRSDWRTGQLSLHPYPCELVRLSFGLRQPGRDVPAVPDDRIAKEIDAFLILGLAFDRRGYRLGHGKGYFDRFLANQGLTAIGLAFDEQLVDGLPNETHDVPMDVVFTPSFQCPSMEDFQ